MEWLSDNWIWLLLGGGMVAMHLGGHRHGGGGGCCGGHGAKKKGEGAGADEPAAPGPADK